MRLGRQQTQAIVADVDERLRRLADSWAPVSPAELETPLDPVPRLQGDHWARRSWRAFVVLLAAIAVAGGWLWWQAQPRAITAIPGESAQSAVSGEGGAVQPVTGDVTVHVAAGVRNPGLITLPAGSRVADAIEKAGGARSPRLLESVNLARVLVDGEQIVLGQPPATSAAGGRLSLGGASAAELEQLPGVGPVLAQRIVQWRTDHGPFRSVDDLNDVSGVGDSLMEQIRPLVSP